MTEKQRIKGTAKFLRRMAELVETGEVSVERIERHYLFQDQPIRRGRPLRKKKVGETWMIDVRSVPQSPEDR